MSSSNTNPEKSPPPTAGGVVKNVILAIIAIPVLGAMGAGVATLMSEQATEKSRVTIARAGGKCELTRQVPSWIKAVAGEKFHSFFDQTVISQVRMEGDKITDSDVAKLVAAPKLESLYIDNCNVTSASLPEIAKLQSLKTLTLSQTQVDDISALAALPALETLDISFSKVRDANLSALLSFQKLRAVNLKGLMVTDAGIVEVAKCVNLEQLGLGGALLGPTGLQPLHALKNLKRIILAEAKFDREDFNALTNAVPGFKHDQ